MIIRFNILSPNNTGAPDYDICGQGASVVSPTGLFVSCKINGVDVFSCLPDVDNISVPVTPFVVGGKTVTSFSYSPVYGFLIQFASDNTIIAEDTLAITISKPGYQSYSNTFKLYDYDLGNSGLISGTNPDFDFYLINNTNNVINGIQTKAFSKFISYRRLYTNEVYYYNAVGTQGQISYSNVTGTDSIPLFSGQNGIICASTGIDIEQTIVVRDNYNNILDTCQSEKTINYLQWLPSVNVNVSCQPACDSECISNLATGTYTTIIDTTNLSCINIDDVSKSIYRGSPYLNLISRIYDYQGIELLATAANLTLDNCGDTISPIVINLPALPELGDILIVSDFQLQPSNDDFDTYHFRCRTNTKVSVCNWYSIKETLNCGEFIVNNCSFDDVIVTIKQLQEDMTFLEISQVPITQLSTATITLQGDGVYTFEVPSKTEDTVDILIVINDCAFKACLFTYLNSLICNKRQPSCTDNIKDYYDFNSFILNAHTYFALLNEEYNFNYIYKALSVDKIKALYTIKQYLDGLSTYCADGCNPCKDCK